MRKVFVVFLAVFAILGLLAPPSFAQAPAPKVTITGLVDFVATAYNNLSWAGQAGFGQTQLFDPTRPEKGSNTYSRERGVFTLTGEVGRTKGVWAIELDFTNGAGAVNAGNAFGRANNGIAQSGTTANFDLDTDVAGAVETKWLYLETPVTGPGSIMPFVPVPSIGRFGGQPFRGHDYKFGILASGDFPGGTLETTWAPNLRSTLTYVQIAESLDGKAAPNQKKDWAILASLEFDVFKGLTVKPTFAYAEYHGGNCGTANLGTEGTGGWSTNACPSIFSPIQPVAANAPPSGTGAAVAVIPGLFGPGFTTTSNLIAPGLQTRRYYMGGDLRWTSGPWSFQPTFIYLYGTQAMRGGTTTFGANAGNLATAKALATGADTVDIRSWIFDSIQGFRTGPLNIESRIMWTPGQAANKINSQGAGGTIRTYQPINSGFAYMAGWTEIWTGTIDYISSFLVGQTSGTLRQEPGYDKYGRIFAALATDYALTPALTLKGLVNVSWTDKAVDTKSFAVPGVGLQPRLLAGDTGDARFLGTELNAGLTYRFAPNVAFDLIGAYLFTGHALDRARTAAESAAGINHKAEDVQKAVARSALTRRKQVIKHHPGADEPGASRGMLKHRDQKRKRADKVRHGVEQRFALPQRLEHQHQLAVLEVTHAAVDQASGAAGGAGRIVELLYEGHR